MGFLRRIGSMLGFVKDEAHVTEEDGSRAVKTTLQREARGFSVKVPVVGEKSGSGPVVVPCSFGEGGVQGFRWYSRRLRIDEDGDVADEFLEEVLPPVGSLDANRTSHPSFEVKYTTRPALVRKQAIIVNGNVYPCMEYQGMLRWV